MPWFYAEVDFWHRVFIPLCSRAPDFIMDQRGKLSEALFAEFLPLPLSNQAHREVGLPTKQRGGLWVVRAFGRAKVLTRLQAKALPERSTKH